MDAIWVTAILQGGAMMILAYHFLVSLPALLERIAREQQAERMFWAGQAQLDREECMRREERLAEAIRQRNDQLDARAEARAKP